jgi:hypothetical protein
VCGCPDKLSYKQSLNLPGPGQLIILHDYFSSLPAASYNTRRAAQELLISSSAPSDRADRDARIDIMRDDLNGSTSWVIAHSGMGYDFVLDLTKAFRTGSTVMMERLDPRTGERAKLDGVTATESVWIDTPTKGSVREDWVFIFTQ